MGGSVRYLVRFSRDWADEFTAEGLAILSQEQLDKLHKNADKMDWFFGTNEGYYAGELETSDFKSTPITREEEETLCRLIPDLKIKRYGDSLQYSYGGSFGQFPDEETYSLTDREEFDDE